jgi:hypothetical protein
MDPLGHLAPWLFRDMIDKENSECMMRGCREIRANSPQLILGQQLVLVLQAFSDNLITNLCIAITRAHMKVPLSFSLYFLDANYDTSFLN